MKLTIIVPTRNGSLYVPQCLKTCLASDDKNIEIIVSDNDTSEKTREALTKFTDSRLKYFRTSGNLSMRQNYEFALSQATGDYIIMIGDDDGVLQNGISTLRRIIEKYRPDVINWRILRYLWPSNSPGSETGIVKYRRRDFFGPMKWIEPQTVLQQFCTTSTIKYKDGANLYHGCVARNVVDALKKKTGEYFQAANPDIYASLANLTEAKSMLWVKHPITIGGESEKSIGSAASKSAAPNAKEAESLAGWGALANADTVSPELQPRIRRISPYTYAVLNRVNRLVCNNALKIDHSRWRYAINSDMGELPPDELEQYIPVIEKLYSDVDPRYVTPNLSRLKLPQRIDTEKSGSQKTGKKKATQIEPKCLTTVATLATRIDAITGSPYTPTANRSVAVVQQLWKVFKMEITAKRLKSLGVKSSALK